MNQRMGDVACALSLSLSLSLFSFPFLFPSPVSPSLLLSLCLSRQLATVGKLWALEASAVAVNSTGQTEPRAARAELSAPRDEMEKCMQR